MGLFEYIVAGIHGVEQEKGVTLSEDVRQATAQQLTSGRTGRVFDLPDQLLYQIFLDLFDVGLVE